jgi:hypothetical protein
VAARQRNVVPLARAKPGRSRDNRQSSYPDWANDSPGFGRGFFGALKQTEQRERTSRINMQAFCVEDCDKILSWSSREHYFGELFPRRREGR